MKIGYDEIHISDFVEKQVNDLSDLISGICFQSTGKTAIVIRHVYPLYRYCIYLPKRRAFRNSRRRSLPWR